VCSKLIAVAAVLSGCGAGYHRVLTTDEMPAGTCAQVTLAAGESCTPSARDYSVGATVSSPRGYAHDVGGALWYRWPLFDVALDERSMRRDTRSYHSLAGGVGTHLRPLILWPDANRYVDVVVDLGFELGAVDEARLQGRGDGYIGAALDLFSPDVGPFRYLDTGVPGVRLGIRYTSFVEGWASDTSLEVGLIWRWGVPIDLHRHWTLQRSGD
jgi:hypothetical protein